MNNSRLYRQFQPSHYALRIEMHRQERHFSGTVTITGSSMENAQSIQLHAHRLTITKAIIDGQNAAYQQGEQDILMLTSPHVTSGEHRITLEFDGTITNPMHGLYPCYFKVDGQDEELLATQFESHHAREVFPCVDEPEAKATFDLTLVNETGISVVSNTPIKTQHEQNGMLVTTFETTPRMSTYLLAWVVGKLDYLEATTKDGVLVHAYAVKGKRSQLSYALDSTVKSLEFMNEYYGVPYPLPKCDIVALPDFSAGAMENWGCITFRENVMLVDEHSSTHTKQLVTMIIAHELAHQWFGNLVTMRWWNDLWLNESFANWMEYYVPSQLYPEWDLMTQYYDEETTFAIERDSLASVQKIQQEVHTPEEIQALFDPAIVYAKGGSLINMLHAHLGDEPFRKGLQLYFQRHAYGNTEAADLWKAWGETSGRDVMGFMLPWITQAGLPVVTVQLDGHVVNVRQRRFFSNSKAATGEDTTTWPIPLLADGQIREELFDQANASFQLQTVERPFMLNQGRTGYYLSVYDNAHVEQLAQCVRDGKMSVVDRLGLLSDYLDLGGAGLQPFASALKLLDSYRQEDSMPVWGVMSSYIGSLKLFADDDEMLLNDLRAYVHDLAYGQYQRLGWQPIDGESYFDGLLRPMIIAHMAYAEDGNVIATLQDMFKRATMPNDIWSDIRETVFAVAAKYGDAHTFEKLWSWYRGTTSAEERVQLAHGLTATRDPSLIRRGLDLLTTDDVKLQDLFYWLRGFMYNRYARDQTWHWMQDNWQWVIDHFGNDMHYTDFPKCAASAFSKPEQLASYRKFFDPMSDKPGIGRVILQGIEDIESRIQWRERDEQAVAAYLQTFNRK